ncbi:hypothetical protein D9758_000490 [Tetrapyrgos nigripes]|uniref:RNA-dependent RNA polymerase n=1 Tax=Tetrapyrgos nigripes TaxID=182062 RepID=A0A8H5LZL3_9AGAR|nr:hypothetical protein D9758_000490 [Tetrapyrgos nigripes]
MEIFVSSIHYYTSLHTVTRELADLLHQDDYITRFGGLNFDLRPQGRGQRNKGHLHSGNAFLTLPSWEVGEFFLNEYGDRINGRPPKTLRIGTRLIRFKKSRSESGRQDIVDRILGTPYVDPVAAEERDCRLEILHSKKINIRTVQFGWDGRDGIYSIEWEHSPHPGGALTFDSDRREYQITIDDPTTPKCHLVISIRPSQIIQLSAHVSSTKEPVLYFSLSSHPTFLRKFQTESISLSLFGVEIDVPFEGREKPSERLACLPIAEHDHAPYTSLALRFICSAERDLEQFAALCVAAQFRSVQNWDYPAARGRLFSSAIQRNVETALNGFHWCVAFQVEALVRTASIDMTEVLQIIPDIETVVRNNGERYAARLLQFFGPEVKYWYPEEGQTIREFFALVKADYTKQTELRFIAPSETSLFESLHLEVTPTTMFFEGPFLERSNRVVRLYPDHHDSFLRVAFVEEDGTSYRFDRDIDGPAFIRDRVGSFLVNGLTIAGRKFEFLGYSQSALREHAVWFMEPFRLSTGQMVDADTIIAGLGNFSRGDLIRCPARYGARISMAFTATEHTSISVENIMVIEDISTPDRKYDFTDGVGTMSREVAQACVPKRSVSPAIQIRIMGSKGMLSIDPRLQGLTICLRPSMIKFDGADSHTIEVAEAFDRPKKYYLNRPLVMVLEGLGVQYTVFKKFQDIAVGQVNDSTQSLENAARMLERFGLGNAFRLNSVMLNLSSRLGFNDLAQDPFYKQMLKYAVYHVLRDLKNHTRIPIENAWTLVGVADVHQVLQEGEIFACVKPANSDPIFLKGDILISRSPVIHPGDVQIVRAIGEPPLGSWYAKEPLQNTVVFPTQGSRPLPNKLGGGDLDGKSSLELRPPCDNLYEGDIFGLIPLDFVPEFRLPRSSICEAASYEPAERKMLNRPSTRKDIAEFVMEYINSDLVGMIATTWLNLADQSPEGIFDENCLKLSQLHSDAVDYPKSGNPVNPKEIPRLRFREKPDYQAPEIVRPDNADFYESSSAIGRLFRSIDLPDLQNEVVAPRERFNVRRRRKKRSQAVDGLADAFTAAHLEDDDLSQAVNQYVAQYLDSTHHVTQSDRLHVSRIFNQYCSELHTLLATNTLGSRMAMLSEQEAMIGTIAQKTSMPRKRAEQISKLREQTDILVRGLLETLTGGEDPMQNLSRAKLSWDLSSRERRKGSVIGAQSFCWLTLLAIFQVTKEIDEDDAD